MFKGTVDVISNKLSFIDWYVRFTVIPIKELDDKEGMRYPFLPESWLFQLVFLTCGFFVYRNINEIMRIKQFQS